MVGCGRLRRDNVKSSKADPGSGYCFDVGYVDCLARNVKASGDRDHLAGELLGVLFIVEFINHLGRGIVQDVFAASFHAAKCSVLSFGCDFTMASCEPILAHALSMIS